MKSGKTKNMHYADYLQLGQLLSLQNPKSGESGDPAHDEMLFIIVHQAYELWFKQMLHELDSIREMFRTDLVDEKSISIANSRLIRILEIQKILLKQLDVLETMTALDFLEFRHLLTPASGFQSYQFRLLENKMGLDSSLRVKEGAGEYLDRLNASERKTVEASEEEPSLFRLVERWLERTPFLNFGDFDFLSLYRQAVDQILNEDRSTIEKHPKISDRTRTQQLAAFTTTMENFEALFDEEKHNALIEKKERRLSYRATIAALFIHLYREQPILHLPFRFLTRLVDMDNQMTAWRHGHMQMVKRMIGMKIGTGGTSASGYIRQSIERHRVFSDIAELSTYMIPRSLLPDLPDKVRDSLGFAYSVEAGEK